jgi:uncharacterized protein YecE (DUF72 family)
MLAPLAAVSVTLVAAAEGRHPYDGLRPEGPARHEGKHRMKVLVGTASWSDKSLVASQKFYPKDVTTPEGRLRHYATRLPLVEIDTTCYAIPLPETVQAWADRTPAHFTFNAKAFRLFTGHATTANVLPPDLREHLPRSEKPSFYFKDLPGDLRTALWDRFKTSLEPLRSAGKLGMVHFQFAPWIISNRDGQAHVRHCVDMMRDHTVSVEFRNKSWFDEAHVGRTLAFERELNVVHTMIDGPQGFTDTIPSVWESTHLQYALVRLHGLPGIRTGGDRRQGRATGTGDRSTHSDAGSTRRGTRAW